MAIRAALAAWHYIFGSGDQPAAASRTVGGSATPAARTARLAAGRGAERTTKRLPSCSISVSSPVNGSRSAMISGQEMVRPSATPRAAAKAVLALASQLRDHRAAAGLIPQPLEYQRRPDLADRNLERGPSVTALSTMALAANRAPERNSRSSWPLA
jgi:hypothetical protein